VRWSAPRPVGVVGALAPPSLLGLVDVLAPALAAGATAVVVAPDRHPQATAVLAEALAASDLPAGAAGLLTGDLAVLGPALARADVDGLDPAGLDAPDGEAAEPVRTEAAARGLRVPPVAAADPGVARLRAWCVTATVWQPAGS
jgi:hypothetical protein